MRSQAAAFFFQQACALPLVAAGALCACPLHAAGVGAAPSGPVAVVTAAAIPRNLVAPKASLRGSLSPEAAFFAATTIAKRVQGGEVLSVLPTGGMRQTFDEKALVVLEPARLETLRAGDIISYEHADLHQRVVQRVLKPSDLKIAPTTPVKRVVVVIYVGDGADSPALASAGAKPTAGKVVQAATAAAMR
jgi:hypothetical protein